ncbi:MAG: hypothetical protein GXP43_00535 [bacterium]|nr:hypothetical protein [bacterium]
MIRLPRFFPQKLLAKYAPLLLASFLLAFTGLRFSFFLAGWLPMIFFIYYFRKSNKWHQYLTIILLLLIPKFIAVHGGWDMPMFLELFGAVFAITPLTVALVADKYFYQKTSPLISSLVFPAVYVVVDFVLGLTKFGTFSSIALTQFGLKPLIQIAAVTGFEGISFIVFWFASAVAVLWQNNFNLSKQKPLAITLLATITAAFLLGGIYFTLSIPTGPTVKIAGITVKHKSDYWGIIDAKTPKDKAQKYAGEIQDLNNQLFKLSQRAADFGAKIIFWSEANGVVFQENKQEFIKTAQDFAKRNQVYFAPTILVLKYGTFSAENKIIMIDPNGQVAYQYEKTISWYPTESDGVIPTLDTPYGKIASVICFDADFPRFIRQASRQNIDILLLPKIDAKAITPGHTYSGFFRGIEGGFSTVAQVNNGVSAAADYRGNVIAYQDFYTTKDKIMVADVPIKGVKTLYPILGDWFIYLNALFLIGLAIKAAKAKK